MQTVSKSNSAVPSIQASGLPVLIGMPGSSVS